MNFNEIRGVVSDMDGVLWRGDEPLAGLTALFALLRARDIPFVLATNNSSKSPAEYIEKLARMGVRDVAARHIITSGTATASYLRNLYANGATLHVLGGDGLRHVLREAAFTLSDGDADVVVVGFDANLTYDRLRGAAFAIRGGARFVGTNPDVTFPTPQGLAPGAGSILAALQAATDAEPVVIGKPHRPMFATALDLLGTKAEETLMLGDRLGTDIAGAVSAGLRSALLLTGVTTRAGLADSAVQPDAVYDDLPALLRAWRE